MAASRAPAELVTGCGDRDNIGRGESGLKVASRKGHEETRQLFFHGLCRCVTNASNARDHSDRSRAALGRAVRTSQNVSPSRIALPQKHTVVKKNEGVNLIEPRDVL